MLLLFTPSRLESRLLRVGYKASSDRRHGSIAASFRMGENSWGRCLCRKKEADSSAALRNDKQKRQVECNRLVDVLWWVIETEGLHQFIGGKDLKLEVGFIVPKGYQGRFV